MFDKLKAGLAVMRAGSKVADPTAWKLKQVAAADIAAFLGAVVALLAAFDVRIDMSADQMAAIGGGVLAVYGVVNRMLTVATTDKIGSAYTVNTVDARATQTTAVPASVQLSSAPSGAGIPVQPRAESVSGPAPVVPPVDQRDTGFVDACRDNNG